MTVTTTTSRGAAGNRLGTPSSRTTIVRISTNGNIALGQSAPQIHQLFKHVLKMAENRILFADAYPDRGVHGKFPRLREMFLDGAADLQLPAIGVRLREDHEYAKILTDAVSDILLSSSAPTVVRG